VSDKPNQKMKPLQFSSILVIEIFHFARHMLAENGWRFFEWLEIRSFLGGP